MKHLLAVIALLIGTAASAGTVVKLDNTLIISGPIDQTTRYMFDNYFTASITHIQLESPGGVVHEGIQIMDKIYAARDRVSTEAIGVCTSMCAALWMAADKHVYHKNGKLGWHLAYVADLNYLTGRYSEWGIRGLEWDTKAQVLKDMMTYFQLINNKEAFGDFVKGLSEEGLMGHHMWYPTDKQLQYYEGDFIFPEEMPEVEIKALVAN